ncbi:Alginate biosynthesis protein AlgA [BD1-7 clade bacterium]|uniref:mannose-1-phosphate guanylyltransferase n=1 Tax=BD1-7 clade bacterium TaxID=2029982 RepID=A0A5S9QDG2_9GAMM|nr:Alginate biosynthesis protein AlgA [BD1-7 clade bacterium]CAA0115577.1 Alginate biosynthesis protein AlgA [BD1-7 clade bacterium]
MAKVIPVILSGGSGTRLWPMSRKAYPKQLLRLTGPNTMLQQTALRVTHLDDPIVVCNQDHRFMVAEQLQEVGISPSNIILEPVARNTAPAIALAAIKALQLDEQAIIAVFPADHLIKNQDTFAEAIDVAVNAASDGKLVTFGIVPNAPETGYGYIRSAGEGASAVQGFVEKPNLETAQSYVDSGEYFWNSGMFVFKASAYLSELEKNQPAMVNACHAALDAAIEDLDFSRVDKDAFSQSPDDSIDYAVMEKTDAAWMVPLDADWSDVGAWSSLWEVMDKDASNNVSLGDVIAEDCSGCLFQSEDQLIAAIGLEDIVVIDTKDAVLVAKKDRVQDVKKIVEKLKSTDRSEHLLHREVYRPWGSYDSIENGERFQVKRITVKPGASLSLQMHHHRAEHWIVVEGTALVEVDEKHLMLTANQSVYIPLGSKHRLTNPGKIPLELIEVQSGTYLGEDDIVRYEDNYGRVEAKIANKQ